MHCHLAQSREEQSRRIPEYNVFCAYLTQTGLTFNFQWGKTQKNGVDHYTSDLRQYFRASSSFIQSVSTPVTSPSTVGVDHSNPTLYTGRSVSSPSQKVLSNHSEYKRSILLLVPASFRKLLMTDSANIMGSRVSPHTSRVSPL